MALTYSPFIADYRLEPDDNVEPCELFGHEEGIRIDPSSNQSSDPWQSFQQGRMFWPSRGELHRG